ncbi:E3 SUMO-protein ligase pli1 [Fusarium oxysporum f. sp. albedinis]|nr:E3 SUMO-protein ligase pli1 [Fusarium oxysporum f. sp. albedinis]
MHDPWSSAPCPVSITSCSLLWDGRRGSQEKLNRRLELISRSGLAQDHMIGYPSFVAVEAIHRSLMTRKGVASGINRLSMAAIVATAASCTISWDMCYTAEPRRGSSSSRLAALCKATRKGQVTRSGSARIDRRQQETRRAKHQAPKIITQKNKELKMAEEEANIFEDQLQNTV